MIDADQTDLSQIDADQALHQAVALHQAGNHSEARRLYEQVLALRSEDPDALHLLGVLVGAQGAPERGLALIARATALRPDFPTAWFNHGNMLVSLGWHEAALESLNRCLASTPDHSGALAISGRSLLALGRAPEAAAMLQRAVAVTAADALLWNDLGVAHAQAGQTLDAIDAFGSAVRLSPGYAQGHRNLGYALHAANRPAEAAVALEQALALMPEDARLRSELASVYQRLGRADEAFALLLAVPGGGRAVRLYRARLLSAAGRHAEAATELDAVLAAEPDDTEALGLRGATHWHRLNLDAAMTDLDKALGLHPDSVPMLVERGNVLQDRSQFAEALAEYDRALALEPARLSTWVNRGTTLQALHRYPEALAAYDHVLAQEPPAPPDVRLSRGICLLRMGRWQEGWRNFEARCEQPRWAEALRRFAAPRWDGRMALAGKRVLVAGEQGLGDMIQFARFAPRLTALGASAILGVEAPLKRLMQSLRGIDAIAGPSDAPDYDAVCLMMSLPALLDLREADFPAGDSYLAADPQDIAAWRVRLSAFPGLKVGLAWAGDPRPDDHLASRIDLRRSLPLHRLAPVMAVPGVTLVSLQKGRASAQAAGTPILDWSGDLHDYADTAALMTALDLVISVDTSVVHAAGALGRPVWVLNRYDRCWRWRWDRSDTPWYPTMRLFTQLEPGDWDSVMVKVAEALRGYAANSVVQASKP